MPRSPSACLFALVLLLTASPCAASEPGAVLRATLPNGLRVVIVPDRLAPVVATELTYLAGSVDAPAGFPGTAHALEHMMFRGSPGLDKDQLAELGARLGGQFNAETSETVTQYSFTVPATDLGVALHAEALRMRGLSLRQADWALERGAIEQEVSADLSSPFYTYTKELQAILFAGTPYDHDALGTRPSFDRTDTTLLRRFYQRWYAPNNAILVIAGDVQPEQALAEVEASFGAIPARPVPSHPAIAVRPVTPQTLALKTDFAAGLVTVAYRMPGLKSGDFAAADILSDVLSSNRGALYALVPTGKALMARFSYRPLADVGFGMAFAAFPAGDDPSPVLADIRRIMADIVRNGAPPELVAAAKRRELAQLGFQADNISGLAEAWSQALALQGLSSPDDLARAYSAVTVDDVNRLARQILDPVHAVTAILTPQGSGKPERGKGFGSDESFDVIPDHPVTLPEWATEELSSLALPDPVEPPDVSVLPNGLRLIVQPEHVSHTVSVYGRVHQVAATQEPPGKEGVAMVTGRLFKYGTHLHDRVAFQEALDDIAAQLGAGPFFYLKVLTPQFERGMQLLAENELHPAFPADAFPVVRQQMVRALDGMLRTPDYLFRHAASAAIVPADDAALRQPTPDTVSALQPDDVLAFYASAYRPDLTTLVVVGDVTAADVRRIVIGTFGAWLPNGPTPAIDLPPVQPSGSSQMRIPDRSSLQADVALTEALTLPAASPDRYTLILGNVILGDGFSSRLYRDLRVRTGYVYSVGSEVNWTRTRADFTITFGSDPAKVNPARLLAVRDLKAMQAAPVSDADLTRAKAQVLRQLQMQRASVPEIAGLFLERTGLGLPLEAPDATARRYLAITAPQIQQAFTTWLRPDDLAQVVKGPAAP